MSPKKKNGGEQPEAAEAAPKQYSEQYKAHNHVEGDPAHQQPVSEEKRCGCDDCKAEDGRAAAKADTD